MLTVHGVIQRDALEEDQKENEIGKCGHKIDQFPGVASVQAEERKQNGPGNEERQQHGPIDFR